MAMHPPSLISDQTVNGKIVERDNTIYDSFEAILGADMSIPNSTG